MLKLAVVAGAAAIALAGCNESRPGAAQTSALPHMSVAFNWCSGASPSFKIGQIPTGTKSLRLKLVDRDVPTWNHGGGDVQVGGPTANVPCGAISGAYNGPNPPAGQVHTYEWTLTALDGSGAALAIGTASKKYPQ
ncbi:phospholipid-binding protein [Bosea sp. UC22_33]|uniref:phospholipid-binding protein n=1 Tax=Bosea sp. UC22_33 TaxID=3350165 RepID=UPI003671E81B